MELKILKELQEHIWKLKKEEFEQLESNILKEGIRDKIIVWNDIIVDGHNRYEIAKKHGLTFDIQEMEFNDIEEVKDWMDANQLGRRNLTEDQWQISIGRRYNREKKKQGTNNQYVQSKSEKDKICTFQKTSDKLSEEYKIHPNTVKNYAKKAIEYEELKEKKPEVAKAIETGEKSFKEIKKEEKKAEILIKNERLKQKEVLPATGKYDVIVIDPPWQMEKIERDVAPNQLGFDYPTMNIDEIKKIDIPNAEDCHVFMWTTQKHHRHGWDIFDAWNVRFICEFVWHKNGGFQPFNLPQFNHEYVMYGRIGSPAFISTKAFPTCFTAKRTGHSKKPDEFYDMIRRVTVGKRIDMFNRRKIDGFDVWGNES